MSFNFSDGSWSRLCWAFTFTLLAVGAVLGLAARWLISHLHVTFG